MTELPSYRPDRSEVRRAGKQLARGNLAWSDDAAPETLRVFQVANAWRDLHAFPMARIRSQVIGQLMRLQLRGNLTAARLKRLPSIRKKLRTRHLDAIQDLAGIRVILPTLRDVERVSEACRMGLAHTIWDIDDYIASPRKSGYRSLHLKLEYRPKNSLEEICRDCRAELQIRTRLQHAWATAVEAVGLFRGENLKGGEPSKEGGEQWLRLFVLMASEIALIEKQPEVAGAPRRSERIRELREINRELKADAFLDSISQAINYTNRYYRVEESEVYLIRFDLEERRVSVRGYTAAIGALEYHKAEQEGERFDTVLVATNKVESLKAAFPNYFGDTQLFAKVLRRIIRGKDVPEFVLPPQTVVAPPPRQPPDLSWLRRSTKSKVR